MKLPAPTHRDKAALLRLRYQPPAAVRSPTYSTKALQRWYYQAGRDPAALVPASRVRGFATPRPTHTCVEGVPGVCGGVKIISYWKGF